MLICQIKIWGFFILGLGLGNQYFLNSAHSLRSGFTLKKLYTIVVINLYINNIGTISRAQRYKNKYKIELADSYKFEMQQLGQFYDFYKLQHDSDYANKVYIEFKDLETKAYLGIIVGFIGLIAVIGQFIIP